MRSPAPQDVIISSHPTAHIQIQNLDTQPRNEGAGTASYTYVANNPLSFAHPSAKRMTFGLTLSGQGGCRITVNQNKFTSVLGDLGPSEDTSKEFTFDTTYTEPPAPGFTTVYDSTSRVFSETNDHVLGSGGGAFLGFSDLTIIGGDLYVTAQVIPANRGSGGTPQNELSYLSESKGVFFRIAKTQRGIWNANHY